jgi:hypothetical protein
MRSLFEICLIGAFTLAACSGGLPAPTSTPAPIAPSARPNPPTPVFGQFDPASVSGINLADYPVIPTIDPSLKTVFDAGVAQGNNPRVFSKLGDCMTENPYFLVTFDEGQYALGDYADLQTVLDHFGGAPARTEQAWDKDSFGTVGLAAAAGFNVAAPLDATWANPQWCQGGESPLACEYRLAKPSFAVIMFGTNDAAFTEAGTYDYFLRAIVQETLNRHIIPLLNTFPTRPEHPEKSLLLNQIVVKVAQDYGLPLINLNRAIEPLPYHGVDPNDPIHLSVPPNKQVDHFTPDNLQYGFTMRNLVTLQALKAAVEAVK